MGIEVALTVIGFGVTVMAGAITYLAWRNGKVIRENTETIIKASRENTENILRAIRESNESILTSIKTLGEKMDEGFRLIALFILAETPEEKRRIAEKILSKT